MCESRNGKYTQIKFSDIRSLQNRVVIEDLGLILWGIEDIAYIFHLRIPKPPKPYCVDLVIDKII